MFARVVIKLSGEALSGGHPPFDDAVIDSIASQIRRVLDGGTQVALVVGGGNFWRGRSSAGPRMDRVKADQIGMLATVMNAVYLTEVFKRQGVNAIVMTPVPFGNIATVYERDDALRRMAEQTVVINAAGLGHPFFSTDTITALRAAELNADCVLYAKNVDGVYDCDPRKYPEARKYKTLSYQTAIADALGAADLAALHLSSEAGIPSFVFSLDAPESIIRACAYPETEALLGTFIHQNAKEDFYVYANETL